MISGTILIAKRMLMMVISSCSYITTQCLEAVKTQNSSSLNGQAMRYSRQLHRPGVAACRALFITLTKSSFFIIFVAEPHRSSEEMSASGPRIVFSAALAC